jgi:murein DD-endopeptidase MepM/ murein hydrolase activator NlpD
VHDVHFDKAGTAALGRLPIPVSSRPRLQIAILFGGAAVIAVAIAGSSASPAVQNPLRPPQQLLAPQLITRASAPAPRTAAADAPIHASGKIGANLTDSLQAAGVPERIGREYVGVLGRAIPLADGLSVEDRFDLVYEPGAQGRLLYVGLDRVARADVELLKWTDGKHMIWVNADGVGGSSSSGMRMPVPGRMTSGFGERFHPILGYERMHTGVDLAAAMGTPIVAAADGRVVSAGWHGGYGQLVAIAHAGGLETMYGHMSRIVATSGEMVHQGQLIGYVGATGMATGPHLHYEVRKNGRPVNPLSVKVSGGPAQLEGEKLHRFQDTLRGLLMR